MKHVLLSTLVLAGCSATSAPTTEPLLLVGNKGEDTVSVIELDSGAELVRIETSHRAPHEIALSPDGTQAAVVNYADQHIDIIDLASRSIARTVDLGQSARPHGLVWLPDGRIIASAEGAEAVMEVLPGGTVETTKTNEAGTHMVAVSEDGQTVYAANLGAGTISQIDLSTDTLVRTVEAGAGVEGIALTKDGRELWVSNREANTVIAYAADDLSQLATIPVGQFPLRIIASPDGKHMVTSNLIDGTLSVIDVESRELTRTIPVSGGPSTQQVTILFNADGSRLYVAETGVNMVAEIDFDSGRVLRRIQAGRQGDGLALVP